MGIINKQHGRRHRCSSQSAAESLPKISHSSFAQGQCSQGIWIRYGLLNWSNARPAGQRQYKMEQNGSKWLQHAAIHCIFETSSDLSCHFQCSPRSRLLFCKLSHQLINPSELLSSHWKPMEIGISYDSAVLFVSICHVKRLQTAKVTKHAEEFLRIFWICLCSCG